MKRNDFDPANAPTEMTTITSTHRSSGKAFGSGFATGFALCALLFGGGFAAYQFRSTNNTIASGNNEVPASPPSPIQPAPTVSASTNSATPTDSAAPTAPTAPASSTVANSPAAAPTTGTYEANGTSNGTPFNVRVLELKRMSGNSVLLRMLVTNTGQSDLALPSLNLFQNSSIYVIDPQAQKKAYPLEDGAHRPLASQPVYGIDPGKTIEVFAQFPAPAATTQKLTIYFPETSSPIADVPITQ